MDATKRERLEQASFRVGTVAEFLGLTPEESEMVEIRVTLAGNANVGERFIAPSSPAMPSSPVAPYLEKGVMNHAFTPE